MEQDQKGPFSPGERVKVHRKLASEAIKQRLYKVVKFNATLDLLQLEWEDAPKGSKEQYLWILKDFVRKA